MYPLFYSLLIFSLCLSSCQSKRDDKIIRIATSTDISQLDPRKARSLPSLLVTNLLFEGLMKRDKEGHVQCGLCENVSLSEDKKTYRFFLKKNALWSNREPILASDFASTIKSILGKEGSSPNAHLLFIIKNAKSYYTESSDDLGVRVLDSHTLEIELEQPVSHFLELLSLPIFFPYKAPHIYSGPFCIKKHTSDTLVLEKNSAFSSASKNYPDTIIFQVTDENSALQMFETGEVDWIGSPLSILPLDAVPSLQQEKKLSIAPASGTSIMRVNCTRPYLQSKSFRKKLSQSIERSDLTEHVLCGDYTPSSRFVPHSLYPPPQSSSECTCNDASSLSLLCPSAEIYPKMAQVLQSQLKKNLSLDVHIELAESQIFYSRLQKGDFDLALSSWFGDFTSPLTFLEVFENISNGTNSTGWENSEYKTLLAKTRKSFDTNEREAFLHNAEELLLENSPVIPLYHYVYRYVKNKKCSHITLDPFGYFVFEESNANK